MKKIPVLTLWCLLVVFPSRSQERFDAQIFVNDFNEQAIADAVVELYDPLGNFVSKGTTDERGAFLMNMAPGKYQIKLKQNGELKKERLINLPVLEGRRVYHRVRIFVLYEERKQFTLENLLFEYNSAHIYEESYEILDKLVDYLRNEGEGKFEIGGHTDSDGSDKDNLLLSQNRAQAVCDYLIERGIATERLVPVGYGEGVPVASNETDAGMAQNRRTEVKKLE